MPHNILVIQIDKLNAANILQHLHSLRQARGRFGRQVDLGDVASDDELGRASHAGEEHLQLAAGGVLCLVEDDEGMVQSAAAHEGQGRNLDGVVLR